MSACANNSHASAQLSLGVGSYEVDVKDQARDSTGAGLFELAIENAPEEGFGGGIRVRGVASRDDLTGVNEARDGEWFLHGTYDGGKEGKRLPLRFGALVRKFELQDSISEESVTWSSFGPKAEFAPRLPLNYSDEIQVSLTGLLGLGYGITSIEDDVTGLDFDTDAVFVDAGAGLRWDFNQANIALGYRYLSSRYAESDVTGVLFVREVDTAFSGFVFTLGFTF